MLAGGAVESAHIKMNRLVLPHEEIKEGQKYYISPFGAELKSIDDLVIEG